MVDDSLPPISVRLIWKGRDTLRRHGRRLLPLALLAVVTWWAVQGIYAVDNGASAALLRFGALVDDAIAPGLHFRLGGIDNIIETRTGEVFRLQIEGDFAPRLDLVTGDENLISATLTVQYRITRLGDYLFVNENVNSLLVQTIRADFVAAIAAHSVDDVLTSAKARVEQQIRQQSQQRLDSYRSGVTLVTVNLQSVDPPAESESAFREVLDARAEAAEIVSRVRAEQERNLSLARGKAAQLISEAEAAANSRVASARGAAQRFADLLQARRRSPGLTRTDLYARTVRQVLSSTRLILVTPGEASRVDINLIDPR